MKINGVEIGALKFNGKEAKEAKLNGKIVFSSVAFEETTFSSCPFPTSWTATTAGTNYYASNTYGKWVITANGCDSASSYGINKTFDNSTSTYWKSAKISKGATSQGKIDCPTGIAIKPTEIYFYVGYVSPLVIEGYNADSKVWETLHTFTTTKNFTNSTVTLSTNKYYSSFRFTATLKEAQSYTQLQEFQIKTGTIRKEV